ncbi:MAG: hypothetical protein IIX80_02305 [Clostridia bacterium]|nr:hypothetical protein [Clostridia bacterium]
MKLSLFDLHCDTAFRMLTEKQPLERNTFAVSLEKSEGFAQYIQVMALWIDRRLTDDEGWSSFWSMLKNLQNDPAILNERAHLTTFCPERNDMS